MHIDALIRRTGFTSRCCGSGNRAERVTSAQASGNSCVSNSALTFPPRKCQVAVTLKG